ncbi:MAG: FG-GAP-like repeat-containing protein, partial [SAR202 cluster bacterium]|nr:FG-GAP-like repeat-containing protein [SAR202 cluster bacterium]
MFLLVFHTQLAKPARAAANITILFKTPDRYALNVAASTDVVVQFSTEIDGDTATTSTFAVYGSMSGRVSGSYSGGGTDTITFDPDTNFLIGETVSVTLTTGLQDASDNTLESAEVWEFVIEVPLGAGTFLKDDSQSFSEFTQVFDVALGDFDKDGYLDALLAKRQLDNELWLGNGDGVFTLDATQEFSGGQTWGVAVGDLDGDGWLDAFFANNGQADKVWHWNDGTGKFDLIQTLPHHTTQNKSASVGVVLGDLNGDGWLDAFVPMYRRPNQVWLNDGNGEFPEVKLSDDMDENRKTFGAALGDIDGDGCLDVFEVGQSSSVSSKVYINDCAGEFTLHASQTYLEAETESSLDVVMGDINRDGWPDAFVVNYNSSSSGDGVANTVWFNNGSGVFTTSTSLTDVFGPDSGEDESAGVTLGDLNGDGWLDAIVVNSLARNSSTDKDVVYINDGSGGYATSTAVILGAERGRKAAFGDLDNDGDLDIWVGNWGQSPGYSYPDVIWLNENIPDIRVTGNGVEIDDGDDAPGTADGTDFGNVYIHNGTSTTTFTIHNDGNAALSLHASSTLRVVVEGEEPSGHLDFTVTTTPATSTVSVGGSVTFVVNFNPSATGTRAAILSISNDDPDEDPYTFSIRGTGTDPEISVTGNGTEIAHEDDTPTTTDGTDFGSVYIHNDATSTTTFTIHNDGNAALSLHASSTLRVVVEGEEPSGYLDFTVTTTPATSTVSVGGSVTFVVNFNPSATGTRAAILSISNDDPDEDPYTFSIRGTGTDPEISVTGNGTEIAHEDDTPTTTDGTDFGSVYIHNDATSTTTFTIHNDGNAALSLHASSTLR